jgi:hypothetical protein
MLPRYETLPDPSYKEKLPEIRSLGRHPWEITLREFIEIVRRNYGIEIKITSAAIAVGRYLRKDGRMYPIPVADENRPLAIDHLYFLCDLYRIPPEDFGLMPQEPED